MASVAPPPENLSLAKFIRHVITRHTGGIAKEELIVEVQASKSATRKYIIDTLSRRQYLGEWWAIGSDGSYKAVPVSPGGGGSAAPANPLVVLSKPLKGPLVVNAPGMCVICAELPDSRALVCDGCDLEICRKCLNGTYQTAKAASEVFCSDACYRCARAPPLRRAAIAVDAVPHIAADIHRTGLIVLRTFQLKQGGGVWPMGAMFYDEYFYVIAGEIEIKPCDPYGPPLIVKQGQRAYVPKQTQRILNFRTPSADFVYATPAAAFDNVDSMTGTNQMIGMVMSNRLANEKNLGNKIASTITKVRKDAHQRDELAIAARDNKIAARDATIAARDHAVASRDATIANLRKQLGTTIAARDDAVAGRDSTIANLRKLLDDARQDLGVAESNVKTAYCERDRERAESAKRKATFERNLDAFVKHVKSS